MTTLLLLPGLDGTGLLFEEFAACLGHDVDVVIVSYPAERLLGYAELESIARSHIPLGKPYFLLGESFSGPVALSIAASPPPGLLGVILSCSFARNPLPLLAPLRSLVRRLPAISIPVSLLSPLLLGRYSTERLRALLAKALAGVAPEVLRFRTYAALDVDLSAILGRVDVPLIYLRAREDRVVGRSSAEQIVATVPNAQIIEFTSPHFLLQVLPEESAVAVNEFIRQNTKKRP